MHQQWQLRRAEPTFGRKRANKLDASRAAGGCDLPTPWPLLTVLG